MHKKTFAIVAVILVLLGLNWLVRHPAALHLEPPKIDGAAFYAYQLPDVAGKVQPFAAYKGKVVVLNFWATWCPPCREEMPEFSAFHTAYQSKNVVVIGVAQDEPEAVKDFLQASPTSYPIYVENGATDLSAQLGNTQHVLPYTLILDKDGNVVKTMLGLTQRAALEDAIKPLLAN